MKKMLLALGAISALALSTTAANAATTIITPSSQPAGTSFVVSGNPFAGSVSATFGHTGIPNGSFTDLFQFTLGQNGTGSGSVITSVSLGGFGGATDLDITSVFVNGVAAIGTLFDGSGSVCTTRGSGTCGAIESFAVNNVAVTTGTLNTVTINGLSRGNGSFGGNATFAPGVPEPATWALMVLGFGAMGFALRAGKQRGYAVSAA